MPNNVIKDIWGVMHITQKREEAFNSASEEPVVKDNIKELALSLHPGKFNARVTEIRNSSKCSKIIRLESDKFAYFKSGQFLTLELDIESSHITRPYSIISSPKDALNGFVEIAVGDYPDGFVSKYLCNDLKVNDELIIEAPLGEFYYNAIRDSKDVLCIAGGMGITPFLSMARSVEDNILDINLTIIHCVKSNDNIPLYEEFKKIKSNHVKILYIVENIDGFVSGDVIKANSTNDTTYFICGSKGMYEYVNDILTSHNVSKRRIRKEVYSNNNLRIEKPRSFNISVIRGINKIDIKALENESIATALERNGLKIHTACRSGVCGACRIRVLSGEFYIPEESDYRRHQDKEFNYVHACMTYPKTDMEIKIAF